MVEGGRLEIVLAVLNCHVGSNPTLSAIEKFSGLLKISRPLFCAFLQMDLPLTELRSMAAALPMSRL